jgi:hypothetical protein
MSHYKVTILLVGRHPSSGANTRLEPEYENPVLVVKQNKVWAAKEDSRRKQLGRAKHRKGRPALHLTNVDMGDTFAA